MERSKEVADTSPLWGVTVRQCWFIGFGRIVSEGLLEGFFFQLDTFSISLLLLVSTTPKPSLN